MQFAGGGDRQRQSRCAAADRQRGPSERGRDQPGLTCDRLDEAMHQLPNVTSRQPITPQDGDEIAATSRRVEDQAAAASAA